MSADPVKQVIILRNDLGMPPGKAASQAAHASIAWLTNRLTKLTTRPELYFESFSANLLPAESEWVKGSFTKIVVQANLEDMMHVYYEAQELGLVASLIIDEGRSCFDGTPTATAVAIGPDYASNIDPLTGDLKLYGNKDKCKTPGTMFHTHIEPERITVCADLPGNPDLSEKQAQELETRLHYAVEDVLAPLFPIHIHKTGCGHPFLR